MYGFNSLRLGGGASHLMEPPSLPLLGIVKQWNVRARGRRQLQRLLGDERLLADIGISRSVAEIEARRAFWDGAAVR